MRKNNVKLILFLVFLLSGSLIALVIPGHMHNVQKRCTQDVMSTITDVKVISDDDSTTYKPVYEFEYNGIQFKVTPSYSTSSRPTVGQAVTLYINPDKPEEFYDPDRDANTIRFLRIFGFVFMGTSVLILFSKPTNYNVRTFP